METFEIKVYGQKALFTDPMTKLGGEKTSYRIPTPEAIKGILRSIYWKPAILWVVDEFRVMSKIQSVNRNVKINKYDTANSSDLFIYTYLKDVEYRIRCHFEFNPAVQEDHNEKKHAAIMRRSIQRGGRKNVFLGTTECAAYVEECDFSEGVGAYDEYDEMPFNLMFHSFEYPEQNGEGKLYKYLYEPVMKNGIVATNGVPLKKMFMRDMTPETPFLKVGK